MKQISVFATGLFAMATVTLVSCKKQVETQVEGDWMKQVIATAGSEADSAIWHFDNGTLIMENLSFPAKSDTAKYVVVEKSLKNYVRIDGSHPVTGESDTDGDWKVIQYKKDVLILAKPDISHTTGKEVGTIVREFTRL